MVPQTSVQQTQRPAVAEPEASDDQPLYVNAKQYNRILKRRQARARLEALGKIPKERKVSLTAVWREPVVNY